MISITKILSSVISDGRRRIKVLRNGRTDGQNAYESTTFGDDSNIPEGYRALYASTGQKGKEVIIGVININQLDEISKGEKKVYSTNEAGDEIQAHIILRNDGNLEVNGQGDFAVRFTPLESELMAQNNALNQELSKIQTAITNIQTTPNGNPGTPTVPGPPLYVATNVPIDISESKIETIKVPPTT